MDFFSSSDMTKTGTTFVVNHVFKLQPACLDSKCENFLNFFHLVKYLGTNESENMQKQCNFGLLTIWTTLELENYAKGKSL